MPRIASSSCSRSSPRSASPSICRRRQRGRQDAFSRGEFQAMFRNIMSPGEATYFITSSFTPDQYMSKSAATPTPRSRMLKIVFAEDESNQEKLKPVFADMMRLLADESPFAWVGYFNATNLWRDRVKNFKPSRGLTINVHDVTLAPSRRRRPAMLSLALRRSRLLAVLVARGQPRIVRPDPLDPGFAGADRPRRPGDRAADRRNSTATMGSIARSSPNTRPGCAGSSSAPISGVPSPPVAT
jgi:hypothetical protein